MNDKILVVEDEENIRTNIKEYLENQNYQVIEAADGEAGLEMVETMKPDLIILDLMLPKVDGMEVCKQVRRNHNTPIIMVTARNEEIDKLLGLELGADDYITKPFSLRELNARIKAVFRRSKHVVENTEEVRTFGKLVINLDRREVFYDGKSIDLTPSEYASSPSRKTLAAHTAACSCSPPPSAKAMPATSAPSIPTSAICVKRSSQTHRNRSSSKRCTA